MAIVGEGFISGDVYFLISFWCGLRFMGIVQGFESVIDEGICGEKDLP